MLAGPCSRLSEKLFLASSSCWQLLALPGLWPLFANVRFLWREKAALPFLIGALVIRAQTTQDHLISESFIQLHLQRPSSQIRHQG